MSDNSHAAMCVYCGEAIIYDTREVTDMAAAHAKIVEHDQQCTMNPLVARIEFLNKQNTEQQAQNDALAAHVELLSDNLQASINGIEWYRHNTSVDWGEADEEHLKYCEEAIKQNPAISLARRDALKQAEEVQRIADEFRSDVEGAYFASSLDERANNLRKQAEGQQLPQETTATSLTAICPDCEGDGNMACTTCSICDGLGALSTEELARLHAERLAEQINNCELECGAYGTYCKCAAEGHQ